MGQAALSHPPTTRAVTLHQKRGHATITSALAAFGAIAVLCVRTSAQEVAIPKVYEPYAFLIGEWDVSVEGRLPAAVSRMLWGPMKTYIRYSGALLVNGKESPNFEGILVWNGVRRTLDMLLVLDLTTQQLVQEQGSISLQPDGSVVREITVYYAEGTLTPPDWTKTAGPAGATARFRHTFKQVSPGRIRASVLRQAEGHWVPSFPGGDNLIMVKRSEG